MNFGFPINNNNSYPQGQQYYYPQYPQDTSYPPYNPMPQPQQQFMPYPPPPPPMPMQQGYPSSNWNMPFNPFHLNHNSNNVPHMPIPSAITNLLPGAVGSSLNQLGLGFGGPLGQQLTRQMGQAVINKLVKNKVPGKKSKK